jgi:hypothetical protein
MCNKSASGGDEHVPPKSIFPKGAKYRKALITVPSCTEHNLGKSMDDEYVKFIVLCTRGTNELVNTTFPSVIRSFVRRPGLIQKFMPNLREVSIGGQETAQITLRYPRFRTGIESIVRGLYFHKTEGKCKLLGDIFSAIFWEQMPGEEEWKARCREAIRKAEIPANYEGGNPRVFQYAFNVGTSGKTSMCRLRFYEGDPIWIMWHNVNVHET